MEIVDGGAAGGGYTGGGGGDHNTPGNGGGGGSYYTGTGSFAKAGYESMPSTSGSTETGHSGNGYARITLVN